MPNSNEFYQAIIEGLETNNLGNAVGIIQYLDKATREDNIPAGNSIKSYGIADKACLPTATCVETVDAIIHCGKGLQSVVKNKGGKKKCATSFQIYKTEMTATSNVTGVLDDQSASNPIIKECFVLTPVLQSLTLDVDSRIDNCDFNDCGSFKDYLSSVFGKAIYNGNEINLVATLVANAGVGIAPAAGDLIDQLIKLWNSNAGINTNKNKRRVIAVNSSVIHRLSQVRDENGNFILDSKDKCPVTGCYNLCIAGMELIGMDDLAMPINNLGQTDAFALTVDNVFFSATPAEINERDYRVMLVSMDNRMVAINYRASGIPAILPDTVRKMTITLP